MKTRVFAMPVVATDSLMVEINRIYVRENCSLFFLVAYEKR
jgi:hypothetical protein